jgi:hypothetical protein
MIKSLNVILFCIFSCCLVGQQQYTFVRDVSPTIKGNEYQFMLLQGSTLCDGCSGHLDSSAIKHNQPIEDWWNKARINHSQAMVLDRTRNLYHAIESSLRLMRSEYYSFYLKKNIKDREYFAYYDQNASSPEFTLDKGDSAVGTVRYRVVCTDCPYPKRWKLYYIFFYNQKGIVVRHSLAYLKKGRAKKHIHVQD